MRREFEIRINSKEQARHVLSLLENMYPELMWVERTCRLVDYIPPYNDFFIIVNTEDMEVDFVLPSELELYTYDEFVDEYGNEKHRELENL